MDDPVSNLAATFAVIKPDQRVDAIPVSPTVYDELDARYQGFGGHSLVAQYAFSADWGGWEQHPAGDEMVVLLSGRVDMVLRMDGGDEVRSLSAPGDYVIVPAGIWHTARTAEPTRMLFITPGAGTRHASDP